MNYFEAIFFVLCGIGFAFGILNPMLLVQVIFALFIFIAWISSACLLIWGIIEIVGFPLRCDFCGLSFPKNKVIPYYAHGKNGVCCFSCIDKFQNESLIKGLLYTPFISPTNQIKKKKRKVKK